MSQVNEEKSHAGTRDKDIYFELHRMYDFHYAGLENRVCKGCIYAKGIRGSGEGCGRLFVKSFRKNYQSGSCDFRKESLQEESFFEHMDRYHKEKAALKAAKQTSVYAVELIRKYVDIRLDGNLWKLKTLDLNEQLQYEDKHFGGDVYFRNDLVRAIMAVYYSDSFDDISMDRLTAGPYTIHYVNNPIRLWGSAPYSEVAYRHGSTHEIKERVKRVSSLIPTIGNLVVWPCLLGFGQYLESTKVNDLMDQLLMNMYDVMTGSPKVEMNMKSCLHGARKIMAKYEGELGLLHFVEDIKLEEFVDYYGRPNDIFPLVRATEKDSFDNKLYFKAIEQYCSFVEPFILNRADRILKKVECALDADSSEIYRC